MYREITRRIKGYCLDLWSLYLEQFQVIFSLMNSELSKYRLCRVRNTAITDKHDYTSSRREPSDSLFRVWPVKEYKSVAKPVHQDFTYRRCKLARARPNFLSLFVIIIPLLSGMAHRKRTWGRRRLSVFPGVPSQPSTFCQKHLDRNLAWRP